MDVISINAEGKLLNLASVIGRSPQSWRGWSCIQVVFSELNENLQHECLFWTKSLIESYIQEAEGRIYFCENRAMHVFCKDVSFDIIEQAAQQIRALVQSESSVGIECGLFSLEADGAYFAQNVLALYNDVWGIKKSGGVLEEFVHHEPSEGSVSQSKLNSCGSRVLLVEDDTVTRWMVSQALQDHCELVSAHSASNAFSVYSDVQPDTVFLDINLPDKSGYDVLGWILHNDPGANVVMFSGDDHIDNVAYALEQGAAGFIGKPFVKNQLLECLIPAGVSH